MKNRRKKRRPRIGEGVVGWVGLAIAVVALFVLDSQSQPHKWNAAIAWSFSAFITAILFGRALWRSWGFWVLLTLALLLHLIAMWWIFDRLLPAGYTWGTLFILPAHFVEWLFTVPIGFVEGILLLGLIARFESVLHPRSRSGMQGES